MSKRPPSVRPVFTIACVKDLESAQAMNLLNSTELPRGEDGKPYICHISSELMISYFASKDPSVTTVHFEDHGHWHVPLPVDKFAKLMRAQGYPGISMEEVAAARKPVKALPKPVL